MEPRRPYRPIGENPDPSETGTQAETPHEPLPRSEDDDPAHDAGAAPDD